MKASLKGIRISPRKANVVAGLVRGAPVNEALNVLAFIPKKAAKILFKVISSASANAETNLKQSKEKLFVKEIVVNKGMVYKRSVSASRGRVKPRRKPTAHVTVVLDLITS